MSSVEETPSQQASPADDNTGEVESAVDTEVAEDTPMKKQQMPKKKAKPAAADDEDDNADEETGSDDEPIVKKQKQQQHRRQRHQQQNHRQHPFPRLKLSQLHQPRVNRLNLQKA